MQFLIRNLKMSQKPRTVRRDDGPRPLNERGRSLRLLVPGGLRNSFIETFLNFELKMERSRFVRGDVDSKVEVDAEDG